MNGTGSAPSRRVPIKNCRRVRCVPAALQMSGRLYNHSDPDPDPELAKAIEISIETARRDEENRARRDRFQRRELAQAVKESEKTAAAEKKNWKEVDQVIRESIETEKAREAAAAAAAEWDDVEKEIQRLLY